MKNQPQPSAPGNLEQVTFNNTVSIEAILDLLIKKGLVSERDFFESKKQIEQRVLSATQNDTKR